MIKLKIKKDPTIKVSSNINVLLDPDFCYIPFSVNDKVLIKNNDLLLKNQPIILNSENKEIRSPISGKFIDIKEVKTINGVTKAVIIQNDFKNKLFNYKGVKNNLFDFNKKDLEKLFEKLYLPILDGENESVSFNEGIKYLIINSVDDEPYVANNSVLLKNKLENMLDIIDLLNQILKIEKVIIVVNNNETDLISNIMDVLGSYPNIELKLIDATYPIVISNHFNYKKDEFKIINITTLNGIDVAIRKNFSIYEKLITITGNGIVEPKLFLVTIGSNIKEIISNNIKFKKNEKFQIIVNGLLRGFELKDLDIIVTPNLSSIILNKEIKFETTDCINCGACVKICPISNNPKYIKDYPNSKTSKKQIEKCIQCGACSYVCPANTNFKKILKKGDKNA